MMFGTFPVPTRCHGGYIHSRRNWLASVEKNASYGHGTQKPYEDPLFVSRGIE